MNKPNSQNSSIFLKKAYLINPLWAGLLFIIGGIIIILIGVPVWFVTGLSASSNQVFAVEAFLSGLLTEQAIKHILKRRIVLAPKIEIPFMFIWPWLCLYFFLKDLIF